VGYLICGKCKSYYQLQTGESPKDFINECDCGGKVRYVENLDIVDPNWKPVYFKRKPTKKDVLKDKTAKVTSIPGDIKKWLIQSYNNTIGKWINNTRNRGRLHRNPHGTPYDTPYGLGPDFINSVMRELNFRNIRWEVVIPIAIAIVLILAFAPGILTLLTLILLVAIGYLFEDRIIGAKNALVTGAVSYFIGSLLTGSFLLLIPFTILGLINGLVCGWVGGYLRIKLKGR
jgi:hypothetical protein